MRLALLSDGHGSSKTPYWRTDNYKVVFLDKLEYVLDYSKKARVKALLWAGDICDTTRDWYLLPDLTELIKKYEVPIIAVYGQHDLYMRSEVNKHSTNLGVLVKAGLVRIAGQDPILIGNSTRVVGASYGQPWPQLPKESGVHNILIVHAPVYLKQRQSEFPKVKIMDANVIVNKYKNYEIILCGDIHRKFVVHVGNRYVVNTGPLMRNKSDGEMQYHSPSFYIWTSTMGLSRHIIPHKPFDQIADKTKLEHKDETKLLKEFSDVLEMESARMTNTNHISIFKTFTKLLKSSPELTSSAKQLLTSMLEDLSDE